MILVTGATGNVGSALTRMLVDAGHAVRALTRDTEKAKGVLGSGVALVEGDLGRPETLPRALDGVERAFFLTHAGSQLAETGALFAKAAKRAGVRHLVVLSSSTVTIEPPVVIGRWHLALEESVKATGIAWTMLRPGNFASNTLRWAPTIKAQGVVFGPHPDATSAPIDPRDIAAVAFAALTGAGHEGKAYLLTGSEASTAREHVEKIGAALGKPVRFVQVPEERARAAMVGAGMPEFMADAILELTRPGPRTGHPVKTTTVRDVTGREARTFDDWVRDNVAAFR
jgi:uncharacterized protein YbjT (DUF2867 family)